MTPFEIVVIILVILLVLALIVNARRTQFLAFSVSDCSGDRACPTGTYCGPDSKCYPGTFGDPCVQSSQCGAGLYCNNGYCSHVETPQQALVDFPQKHAVKDGGPCRLGQRDCAPGLGCGADLKCHPILATPLEMKLGPQSPAIKRNPTVGSQVPAILGVKQVPSQKSSSKFSKKKAHRRR